jgi:TonB-dependent starch-binding outer membrane protein SusC
MLSFTLLEDARDETMRRLTQVRGRRINPFGLVTFALLALALPLVAGVASAQTGTIVGTITDQATKTAIPSVQIQIVGSTRGVISGADGHYRLNGVPSGPVQLRVTRIGYAAATQTANVPTGDVATLDFVLSATQVTLDQVVVTGTQTTERARESGNLVAVIQTDSVNKGAVQTFSDLIAGKAAGVNVSQASGEVGTSARIRIRGNNSISLSNDPLLVIDGIYVDNGSASIAGDIFTGGQAPSRFDDLNPDEIENVEVLKGPSASALYGTAGANGVILVTTKKGSAGHAVWTAHSDYGGVYQAAIYPANFGRNGSTPPDTAGGAAGSTSGCSLIAQAGGACSPTAGGLLQWNPLMSSKFSPFTTGNARYQFGGSVAGGSDVTKYFASGDFNNEHGVQSSSFQTKNNGRVNLQATPSTKTDFSLNAGYLQSRLDIPQNDNNEASAIANGQLGQPVNDARHGYFVLIDPAQSNSIVTSQDIERFTGGATGNFRPWGWLTLTGVTGLDVTNRNDFQLIPIGAEAAFSANNATGFASSNPFQTSVVTAQFNAAAQYGLSSTIHGTSTVGTQYSSTTLRGTEASGLGLVPGTGSVGGATDQFAATQLGNNQVVDIGYYAQQQFGWRDKVFLTGALRVDDNSSFGQAYVPSFYPSVSGSWVIGEEPWFPKGAAVSSLRLRSSFGVSGQHPGFQQAETFYNSITANIPGSGEVPAITLGSIGNGALKPERSSEIEGGLDLGLWRDRLQFQITGYAKATSDALVAVNLAPSIGGVNFGSGSSVAETSTRFQNIGEVDNRGIEMSLTANLINARNTRFDITMNESYNRNKVITLGPGVAPIQFNSVNTGPNIQRIQAGFPLGAFFQPSYSYSDANHDGIIDPSEVTVAGCSVAGPCSNVLSSFQGNRDPAQLFSINPQLTIFKYFKISTLFDNQSDYLDLNFGAAFRCSEFGNCQWDYDPHTTLKNQAAVAADVDGTDAGYLESGTFWKWRELSVRASAPDAWLRHLKFSALSFTIAGRNLRTWTKYQGVDPEINSTPAAAGSLSQEQSEFFTAGLVRYWTGRIDLTF